MGIRGVARAWFENYLCNRHQYIELYGIKPGLNQIGKLLHVEFPKDLSLDPYYS